jgi:uncharacterized protein (DUF305 family)
MVERVFPSLTRPRLIALALVVAFVTGAAAYRAGRPERPGAGSADVGFLHDMIVHHEQAVTMSYPAVNRVTDDEVRGFAKDILAAQQYEIGLMEGWLRRWGYQRQSDRRFAMEWAGHHHPREHMPGMATEAELEEQADATGTRADDLFLALMIPHHRGGVDMAKAALERAKDPEVRRLAELIAKAQLSEIAEMEATRRRLGFPPVPAGTAHH